MPPAASRRRPARTPEDLLASLQDSFNAGDLSGFLAAHDEDATVVVPPDGRVVHGLDNLRAAMAPLLEARPEMTTVLVTKLESDGLALTHARWHLAITSDGSRSELTGLGTMVTRRCSDGTWRIVLDNPLTGG